MEKRERRPLYAAAVNGGAKESGEGSEMLRLMDGIEQAQEDQQNVSVSTGATQEVGPALPTPRSAHYLRV